MLRPLRTVVPLLVFVLFLSSVGCATLYRRQIYNPGKSNYRKPPEKKENVDLLPPTPSDTNPTPNPILPAPDAGAAPGAAAPAAPGMLDAPPAIPGLPPP